MGWSIGYDTTWKRDIGYAVPAICDHPGCNAEIDRGLSYVCGNAPYGGDCCGLYFCGTHLNWDSKCVKCAADEDPFPAKPDVLEWVTWKLIDESWKQWRDENQEEVAALKARNDSALVEAK